MQKYTYICWIHTDAINNRRSYKRRNDKDRRRKTSLTKYLPLTLLQGFERVVQGLRVRGCWRPNRNFRIFTPSLMAVTLCLSCSPDAQPEVQRPTLLGDGFLYCILSATSRVPKLHRGSRGAPRPGVAFPTTSRLTPTETPTVLTSDLTELYNSSTPT